MTTHSAYLKSIISTLLVSSLITAETAAAAAPEIRAQLTPRHSTSLSAEISAAIKKLTVREGERFKKGQLLAAFDCSIQQAQLAKAEATAQGAEQTFTVNSRLAELQSISSLEVDTAKAKLGEAKADIALTKASLQKCKINAPFDGRVVELPVHEHQYLKVGDLVMNLLDDSQLELKLIVPSSWLSWLKPGIEFQVHIDELTKDYPAKVNSLGASIDPVSQTVVVMAQITGKHQELLTGMSGRAVFPQQAQ